MKTLTFPFSDGQVGVLVCPHPMSETDFNNMMAVFNAWRPALTHVPYDDAALEASAYPESINNSDTHTNDGTACPCWRKKEEG